MMTAGVHEPIPEGELVRFLDGQLAAAERMEMETHLARCVPCQRRLHALRGRSERLSELLEATDPAVPPTLRHGSPVASADELGRRKMGTGGSLPAPWLRAAAIVAVLLGIGMFASPARARMADWIEARWAELSGKAVPAAVTTSEPVLPSGDGSTRVEFIPSGADFSLQFASPQRAGGLTLRRGEDPAAVAEVVRGTAELLILPGGIRIQNTLSSTAEYRLTVPPEVERVRIRVGDSTLQVISGLQIGAEERITLSAPTG